MFTRYKNTKNRIVFETDAINQDVYKFWNLLHDPGLIAPEGVVLLEKA